MPGLATILCWSTTSRRVECESVAVSLQPTCLLIDPPGFELHHLPAVHLLERPRDRLLFLVGTLELRQLCVRSRPVDRRRHQMPIVSGYFCELDSHRHSPDVVVDRMWVPMPISQVEASAYGRS